MLTKAFWVLVLSAGAANALSCMAPDAAETFTRLSSSQERYIVVEGRLDYDTSELFRKDMSVSLQDKTADAVITGKRLGKNGFHRPFESTLKLVVHCAGPWCGGIATGERQIAFLRVVSGGYELDLEPCNATVFHSSDKAAKRAIVKCLGAMGCDGATGR